MFGINPLSCFAFLIFFAFKELLDFVDFPM